MINKSFVAAFTLAALMSLSSIASAKELSSPVSIEQVGKMKFKVNAQAKSTLFVVMYDGENNMLYNDLISSQKVFTFSHLADGKYRIDVLDAHRKIVQSKSFNLMTEVKRDLVASK